MTESLRKIGNWFKNQLTEMSRRAKILWVFGAVFFVAIVVFLIMNLTRIDYVVFNRGLTPQQSGQISAKLQELNIAHRVEDSATAIMVDKTKVDEARMELAMAGFSRSQALTYDDLMDKMDFTTPAETRNKLFLQAQRGSIENSLKHLDPIENATVELYIKESSTFLNLNEDVSRASIVLTLKPNQKLSKEQVESILSFVVTSVEGLEPNMVTILDQNGVKLNRDMTGDAAFDSGTQDELKVFIENRIDKGVTDFLSTVYGEKNVRVKSSVKLDFNSEVIEIENFSPPIEGSQEGMVRSINELKENVINKEAEGAVGTDSNTTETPQYPTEGGAGSGYKKAQTIRNYELNNFKKRLEKEKGQISDISVAVIINKKSLVNETLTKEDEKILINLVKASTDDFKKESNITVMATDFYEEAAVPLETGKQGILGVPVWVWILIALGIILVIFIPLLVLRRRKKESEVIIDEIQSEQEELEEIQTDFEDKSSPKYQIEKFIDSRPEIVAQLVKSWMNSD